MLIPIIMLIVASVILAVWYLWFRMATNKRLRQHQTEWDAIKVKCDPSQREDAYWHYIQSLEPDPILGRCFPRE